MLDARAVDIGRLLQVERTGSVDWRDGGNAVSVLMIKHSLAPEQPLNMSNQVNFGGACPIKGRILSKAGGHLGDDLTMFGGLRATQGLPRDLPLKSTYPGVT